MIFRAFSAMPISSRENSVSGAFPWAVRAACAGALAFAVGGCAEVPLNAETTGELSQGVAASDEGTDTEQAPSGHGERRHGKGAKGRHGKHGFGPHVLMHAALRELDLTPERRAELEKLAESARPPKNGGAHAAYQKALAAQLRTGSIDARALADQQAALAVERKAGKERFLNALNQLHQALTPAERTQLADAVLARSEKQHAHRKGADAREGHRAGKHRGHDKGAGAHEGRRAGKHRGHDKGGGWFRGLDLTAEQRAKLETLRDQRKPEKVTGDAAERKAAREAIGARMRAAIESFKTDTFDARTSLPELPELGQHEHTEARLEMLSAMLPELTPDQRTKLADRLEQGPFGHHGKPGARGRKHHRPRGEAGDGVQ